MWCRRVDIEDAGKSDPAHSRTEQSNGQRGGRHGGGGAIASNEEINSAAPCPTRREHCWRGPHTPRFRCNASGTANCRRSPTPSIRDATSCGVPRSLRRRHQQPTTRPQRRHVGHERRFDPDYGPADAAAALTAVIEEAVGATAAAAIHRMPVCDLPARALVDAAKGADLLVVGPRGLGGLRELLLGSVSSACLHHACCPIAVVRGGRIAPAEGREGRIVVGVDGSEVSARALRWALVEGPGAGRHRRGRARVGRPLFAGVLERAVPPRGAGGHVGQAVAPRLVRVGGPDPVVADPQDQLAVVDGDDDVDAVGSGVVGHVAQRLAQGGEHVGSDRLGCGGVDGALEQHGRFELEHRSGL